MRLILGRAFASGVVLASAGLALLDVVRASLRVPEAQRVLVLFGSWFAAVGALLTLVAPILAARWFLWKKVPARFRPGVGALDGLAFGVVGLLLEDMASVSFGMRVALTVALAVSGALAVLVVGRFVRLLPALCLLVGALAVLYAETLPGRQTPWLRFALDTTALGALGAAWASLGLRSVRPLWLVSVLVPLVVAAHVIFRVSRPVRGFLFDYAPHAQTFFAWREGSARPIGNVACRGSEGATPTNPPSPLTGTLSDADVLIVSFDAMRWDQVSAIPEVWNELRPSVSFSRAVAPSPRTTDSFPALFRGVPARQAPAKPADRARGGGAQPTLAEVLLTRGYRAVQVPTHRYFDPSRGLNTGFELAMPPGFELTREVHDGAHVIVPAEAALHQALGVARTTQRPLLLWIHLMEGHEPYRWQGGRGPATKEGQFHAFRDLDRRVAAFVREFRAVRAPRRSIIAIFGDHGEEFGEHGGKFHSTTVYAEQVRAVLALHAPGLVEKRIDRPVSHSALPATIVDLLGFPVPPSFREPSLLGCIEAEKTCPDVAVSQMISFGSAIGYTFERHRLLVDTRRDVERLFDSDADPLEKHDLAEAEPTLLERLSERARRFDEAHCVPNR